VSLYHTHGVATYDSPPRCATPPDANASSMVERGSLAHVAFFCGTIEVGWAVDDGGGGCVVVGGWWLVVVMVVVVVVVVVVEILMIKM
jgi:hypothetical protein